MRTIKIVHLITSLKVGGAEAVLCDIINHLKDTHFEHHVIYFYPGPHVDCMKKMGIATYHITGLLTFYDPFFCLRLMRTLKNIRPDLMHTLLWSANVLGRIMGWWYGIPVVNAIHSAIEASAADKNFFRRCIDFYTITRAQLLIAVSDAVADHLKMSYSWIGTHKISVIKNGIDYSAIQAKAHAMAYSRDKLDLDEDQYVIGSVGRFVSLKNHALLIQAFAQIHAAYEQARLVLIGHGPLEQQLRQQVNRLGLGEYVRFVVGQQAYGYYSLFDCFVLPSSTEGLSIALLEALCLGVPCLVSSYAQGHEVIVHQHNGLIVQDIKPDGIVDYIEFLIKNPAAARSMAKQGRSCVEDEFDVQRMARSYAHVFEEQMMSRTSKK